MKTPKTVNKVILLGRTYKPLPCVVTKVGNVVQIESFVDRTPNMVRLRKAA